MDWFLYDNDLRHERVNLVFLHTQFFWVARAHVVLLLTTAAAFYALLLEILF